MNIYPRSQNIFSISARDISFPADAGVNGGSSKFFRSAQVLSISKSMGSYCVDRLPVSPTNTTSATGYNMVTRHFSLPLWDFIPLLLPQCRASNTSAGSLSQHTAHQLLNIDVESRPLMKWHLRSSPRALRRCSSSRVVVATKLPPVCCCRLYVEITLILPGEFYGCVWVWLAVLHRLNMSSD